MPTIIVCLGLLPDLLGLDDGAVCETRDEDVEAVEDDADGVGLSLVLRLRLWLRDRAAAGIRRKGA